MEGGGTCRTRLTLTPASSTARTPALTRNALCTCAAHMKCCQLRGMPARGARVVGRRRAVDSDGWHMLSGGAAQGEGSGLRAGRGGGSRVGLGRGCAWRTKLVEGVNVELISVV